MKNLNSSTNPRSYAHKVVMISFCFTLFLISFWGILQILVLYSPYSPLSQDSSIKRFYIQDFLPQGWSFFTRDPREDLFFIYAVEDGSDVLRGITDVETFFGASRKKRHLNTEASNILQQIPKENWIQANGSFFYDQLLPSHKDKDGCIGDIVYVKNESKHHSIEGNYYFVIKPLEPWAWYKGKDYLDSSPLKYCQVYVH